MEPGIIQVTLVSCALSLVLMCWASMWQPAQEEARRGSFPFLPFLSAFWHWEKHVCAVEPTPAHAEEGRSVAEKHARVCVCLCVLAGFFYEGKWKKSAGWVGSRARLMGVLGIRKKAAACLTLPRLCTEFRARKLIRWAASFLVLVARVVARGGEKNEKLFERRRKLSHARHPKRNCLADDENAEVS